MVMRTRMFAATLALATSSCAWVKLDPGAQVVSVRGSSQIGACERIGKTHTRTLDRIGPIPRRESKIEDELTSLARNEAVRMGGNAVAPLDTVIDGEQRFGIYRCP